MSHGMCDLALYICTSYIYIYTSIYVLLKILKSNYKKKRHPMMLSWPRSSICWLELKLELVFGLGLGLFLSWAWASSIILSLLKRICPQIQCFFYIIIMWMYVVGGFHHPLLLERICPQIYRFDLEQQPYSYFEN